MKQQDEAGVMSEGLDDVLTRFKAWQAANGRIPPQSENAVVDPSWKLVYGQALDSINRVSSPADPSPPTTSQFLATAPQASVPASSLPRSREEESVTDTVSLRSRGSRAADLPASAPSVSAGQASTRPASALPASAFPKDPPRSQVQETARPVSAPAQAMQQPAPAPAVKPVPAVKPSEAIKPAAAVKSASEIKSAPEVKPVPKPPTSDLLYFRPAQLPARPGPTSAVQSPDEPFARPRHKPAPHIGGSPKSPARKVEISRRQDVPNGVGKTTDTAAVLKKKAGQACVTISAYLQQCETEVEVLNHTARDLKTEMEFFRSSVMSITHPVVVPEPPPAPPVVEVAKVVEVEAVEKIIEKPVVEEIVVARTLKGRLLRLLGVDSDK